MMIILGVIQFVFISVITIMEYKRKSPAVFMWATLLIMFGLMHMINSFTGDYQYSDKVLIEASLFVIGFCLIYVVFRLLSEKRRTFDCLKYDNLCKKIQDEQNNDGFLLAIFVIVLALKIIPYLRYVGSILSSSWATGRNYSDTLSYFNGQQILRIFIYSLSGLCALFLVKKDRKWIIVAVLIILEVLLTRNRIEILPLLCSFIALYIFKKDTISIKTLIMGVFLGAIAIYVVYALRVFRHYGTIADFIQRFNWKDFNTTIRLYLATDNGELGLRRDFYYFINGHNQFENFGKMHSYIRMLLVYIPTSWSFGLKPDDFAISMGKAIGMMAGGSTHPTLFGDCYANAGGFGFLLGGFWAIYSNIIDAILVRMQRASTQILMFVLNGVVFTIIARGSVYNSFWLVAYGIPLLIICEWILNHSNIGRIKITWKRSSYKP